jgi:predicted RNase H-related nuclease YkuK (DUF458 family)
MRRAKNKLKNVMVRNFKTIKGVSVNVVNHTLDLLKIHPNMQVHIGTDSQNNGKFTYYSIVIAYRFDNKGVHYILSKLSVPKILDIWTRLWKETELSIEVAEWLSSQINIKIEIDMDYNRNKDFISNNLIPAAKGWANALGYKVNVKPEEGLISTYAADHGCR